MHRFLTSFEIVATDPVKTQEAASKPVPQEAVVVERQCVVCLGASCFRSPPVSVPGNRALRRWSVGRLPLLMILLGRVERNAFQEEDRLFQGSMERVRALCDGQPSSCLQPERHLNVLFGQLISAGIED